MFSPGSRYQAAQPATYTGPDGSQHAMIIPLLPTQPAVIGYHQRSDGERLDLIAARYLSDPTAFWQLCDANNAMVPDALGARSFIGISAAGG